MDTQPVEYDETTQERITVYAGLNEDGNGFVQLNIGDRTIYLPPDAALQVGLTLQQVAYSAVFLADAVQVADMFLDNEKELGLFHTQLVKAVFNDNTK